MAEAGLQEAVLGSGAGGPLSAPTPWIQGVGFVYYPTGGIIVGDPSIAGGGKGIGTINASHYFINGVEIIPSNYLPIAGGTLTGFLTLWAAPTAPLHAATKKYVDDSIITVNGTFANYLPLAGGTLTGKVTITAGGIQVNAGPVILAQDPATAMQAATKQYVDAIAAGSIAIPDAPSDNTAYFRKGPPGGPNAWVNVLDMGTY